MLTVGLIGEKIGFAELSSAAVRKGDTGRKDDVGLDAKRCEVGFCVGLVDDGDAAAAQGVDLTLDFRREADGRGDDEGAIGVVVVPMEQGIAVHRVVMIAMQGIDPVFCVGDAC